MPQHRILIVTAGPLCRNPRALKEASTLGAAGYQVTVANVAIHAFEKYDRAILENAPFTKISVDVCSGGAKHGILRRLRTWAARRAASYGIQSANAFGPATEMTRRARSHPADLTIVHTELGLAVGLALIAEDRRVAADIEDWHSEDLLPVERRHRPLRLLRHLESTALNRCAYTSTTSHALAGALHARYGGPRSHVITNAFPLQPSPAGRNHNRAPKFFWFSQTIGPGRGLELFLAAWSRVSSPSEVVILGDPRDGYCDHLIGQVPLECRSRIQFRPLVSPAELPAAIAAHDIGLALEQPSIVSRDLTITNKILQYLNAGLAVIASNTAGQREVLQDEPAAGILIDLENTESTAKAISALLSDHERIDSMRQTARRLAERKYCWEKEAPRLLDLVARALAQQSQ